MDFGLDYHDFQRVERLIARLPEEIRNKAISRTMRRMTSMGKTRIDNETAKISKMPKSIVAGATRAQFNGSDSQKFIVRSDWPALIKVGAVQAPAGVVVNLRGSYEQAFLATMKSGHRGVFHRAGKKRLPIFELFAANPANVVSNKPNEYGNILVGLLGTHYLPRLVHEVEYLLSK